MESKFINLVVFATLAQSSFFLQSEAYDMSEEARATLTKISYGQEAVLEATFDSFNSLFDILDRLAAIQVWDLTAETDDYASQVAEASARAKDAIRYSSDAIALVLGGSCFALEKSGRSRDSNMDNVFSLVPIAVGLATSGNFGEDQARIEDIRVAVEGNLINSACSAYDAIRYCLNAKDEKILAAIELAQAGSRGGVIHTTNAIFNAMKVYAAAVSAGSQDVAVLTAIANARTNAMAALMATVEYAFSLHKALVINTDLGLCDAASDLNSIEYAETVLTYSWTAGIDGIFEAIIAFLGEAALGLDDTGCNDFSLIDAAQARTTAKFNAGFYALMDSFLVVNPDAETATAATFKLLVNASHEASARYYGAIVATQSKDATYDEALKTIETLREELLAIITVGVNDIFELIRNNHTCDERIAAEIEIHQDAACTALKTYVNDILDATRILLDVTYGIVTVSEDDFTAVRTLRNAAVSLLAVFSHSVAAGRITALIADLSG